MAKEKVPQGKHAIKSSSEVRKAADAAKKEDADLAREDETLSARFDELLKWQKQFEDILDLKLEHIASPQMKEPANSDKSAPSVPDEAQKQALNLITEKKLTQDRRRKIKRRRQELQARIGELAVEADALKAEEERQRLAMEAKSSEPRSADATLEKSAVGSTAVKPGVLKPQPDKASAGEPTMGKAAAAPSESRPQTTVASEAKKKGSFLARLFKAEKSHAPETLQPEASAQPGKAAEQSPARRGKDDETKSETKVSLEAREDKISAPADTISQKAPNPTPERVMAQDYVDGILNKESTKDTLEPALTPAAKAVKPGESKEAAPKQIAQTKAENPQGKRGTEAAETSKRAEPKAPSSKKASRTASAIGVVAVIILALAVAGLTLGRFGAPGTLVNTTQTTCESPNSLIGGTCCPDANGNGVCDKNETQATEVACSEIIPARPTDCETGFCPNQRKKCAYDPGVDGGRPRCNCVSDAGATTTTGGKTIACFADSDCGRTRSELRCQGDAVANFTKVFSCVDNGTTSAYCDSTTNREQVAQCAPDETCSNGACMAALQQPAATGL